MVITIRKCNGCTKELNTSCDEDSFQYDAALGYGSIADGANLRIDLCNMCLLSIIKQFKIDPFGG